MAERGLYRVKDGWGNQHSAMVEYMPGRREEIPADQYRLRRYQPDFDSLPWRPSFGGPGASMGPREGTQELEKGEQEIRDALTRHWAASDANDFEREHEIYREDALLHYPQSGERICGRHKLQESRTVQPSAKRFDVQRIVGKGDLWVTEFVLSYDGIPTYAVSIMEFDDGKVARETQYFGDPFEPGPSRAHLVERNP